MGGLGWIGGGGAGRTGSGSDGFGPAGRGWVCGALGGMDLRLLMDEWPGQLRYGLTAVFLHVLVHNR